MRTTNTIDQSPTPNPNPLMSFFTNFTVSKITEDEANFESHSTTFVNSNTDDAVSSLSRTSKRELLKSLFQTWVYKEKSASINDSNVVDSSIILNKQTSDTPPPVSILATTITGHKSLPGSTHPLIAEIPPAESKPSSFYPVLNPRLQLFFEDLKHRRNLNPLWGDPDLLGERNPYLPARRVRPEYRKVQIPAPSCTPVSSTTRLYFEKPDFKESKSNPEPQTTKISSSFSTLSANNENEEKSQSSGTLSKKERTSIIISKQKKKVEKLKLKEKTRKLKILQREEEEKKKLSLKRRILIWDMPDGEERRRLEEFEFKKYFDLYEDAESVREVIRSVQLDEIRDLKSLKRFQR